MIIDLTHPINQSTPVFPGDKETQIEATGDIETGGYLNHFLSLSNHIGTHIDAPSHVIKSGKNLSEFQPEKFCGQTVCIDVSSQFNLEIVKHSVINEDDIVILYTGKSDRYYEKDYFTDYPSIPEEVVEFLLSKKIKMVGVDMCSVDKSRPDIHLQFLQNDILIIENLTNLRELKNKQFKLYALPLNLQLDGAPVRVIGEL